MREVSRFLFPACEIVVPAPSGTPDIFVGRTQNPNLVFAPRLTQEGGVHPITVGRTHNSNHVFTPSLSTSGGGGAEDENTIFVGRTHNASQVYAPQIAAAPVSEIFVGRTQNPNLVFLPRLTPQEPTQIFVGMTRNCNNIFTPLLGELGGGGGEAGPAFFVGMTCNTNQVFMPTLQHSVPVERPTVGTGLVIATRADGTLVTANGSNELTNWDDDLDGTPDVDNWVATTGLKPVYNSAGGCIEFDGSNYANFGATTTWNSPIQSGVFGFAMSLTHNAEPTDGSYLLGTCGVDDTTNDNTGAGVTALIVGNDIEGYLLVVQGSNSAGAIWEVTHDYGVVGSPFEVNFVVTGDDGSNVYLYVDGVLSDTSLASQDIDDADTAVYIGGRPIFPGTWLADMNLYGFALLDENIASEDVDQWHSWFRQEAVLEVDLCDCSDLVTLGITLPEGTMDEEPAYFDTYADYFETLVESTDLAFVENSGILAGIPTYPDYGATVHILDAEDLVLADGATVASWTTNTGHVFTLTNGTITMDATGGPSGGKAVDWSGTAYQTLDCNTLSLFQPATILIEASIDPTIDSTGYLTDGLTSTTRNVIILNASGFMNIWSGSYVTGVDDVRDSVYRIYGGCFNGANSVLKVDDYHKRGNASTQDAASGLRLGHRFTNTASSRFKGKMSRVWIWEGGLSQYEMDDFMANL